MKSIAFVLALIALIVASCSQAGKDRPKLGLALHSFDDSGSIAIRRSMETEALDKADLAIIDGQNQQSTQDMQVDSLFTGKIGAIAMDVVDARAMKSLIGKAKERRIPIVFFEHQPSDDAMRSWDKLFFVGTRETEGGTAQGEILAAHWKATPEADRNRDGRVQFIALDGELGGPDASVLADACIKALFAVHIKAERLASEPAGKSARERTTALIAKYGDRIEAVICGDNTAALAAMDSFKAAGYFKPKRNMPIIGLGEGKVPAAIAGAVSAGTMLGAAYTDRGSQGKAIFDLAYALAKGANPSRAGWQITDAKYVWIPYKKYTNGPSPKPKK